MKHLLKKVIALSFFIFFLINPSYANSQNFIEYNKRQAYETKIKSHKARVVFTSKHRTNKEHPANTGGKITLNTLVESLNKNLLESKNLLIYDKEFGYVMDPIEFEKTHFKIYNAEMRDLYFIKREVINRSLVHSFNQTFKQTPIGRRIKNLEDNISRYFIMGYSKTDSEDKGRFYLPGQLSVKEMKEKKAYKISLSSSLYAKPNSLEEDFSIKLGSNFHGTRINIFYDVYKKGTGFNIKSKELNSYLKMNIGICSRYYKDDESISLVLSTDF